VAFAKLYDYRNTLLLQFIGDTHLSPGRPLNRHLDHGFLNLRIDTVLLDRLAARVASASSPTFS